MKTPRSLVNTLHQKGYWTIHQLYNYLQDHHRMISVAYPTLHRYWVDGKLIGRKVGGQVRITKEEVQRFLADRGEVLISTGEGGSASSSQPPSRRAKKSVEAVSAPEEVYQAPLPPISDDPDSDSPDLDEEEDESEEAEGFTIPIQHN